MRRGWARGSFVVRTPRGRPAVSAVVEDFVARCAADDRINGKFARTDIPRLKKMLVDQVTRATDGPATYAGRDMKETHARMEGTAGEFDALVEDLVASLDHLAVPKEDQGELLGPLAPMRGEIVEIESPESGQPLPETYQPAPALS
ncbi:MAG TPA: group 1 truncated hemoglobin [Actinomycetota bacterium]|nr:group 1 truncated hemoglobin [Actinomycetota bacterium]